MNHKTSKIIPFPAWIRVFGIGEDSKNIIDQIKAENYPDVEAIYLTKEIFCSSIQPSLLKYYVNSR